MLANIALDVDGILTDFDGHWRQCAERVLDRAVSQVSGHHHLRERYALTRPEYDLVWDAFHADEWHRLPLYLHAADLVLALEHLGCRVWAVTSVDHGHAAARAASLAGLIPAKRVVCVGHAASPDDKADVLYGLGAIAFLDDHPANVNASLGIVMASVLLDRGYEGLEAPEHGATVIDDPMDFPVLVEQLLQRTGRAA
jgi:FMN phosphatase YigB (HAD superfamily)